MPHSTRRIRRPPPHTKRTHLSLDDGWTLVTHSGPSTHPHCPTAASPKQQQHIYNTAPAPAIPGLTSAKLGAEYARLRTRWESTSCAKELEQILGSADLGRDGWAVDRAVAVGLGSMSRDWEGRLRSMWQFVLFLWVVEMIRQGRKREGEGKQGKGQREAYAQDPAFNALDETFLRECGVEVVKAPDAASKLVTPDTFLFAPFLDWQVLLPEVLDGKDPLLYVGNEVMVPDARFSVKPAEKMAECRAIAECFIKRRTSRVFPPFELHQNGLEGLVVYWKKAADDEE